MSLGELLRELRKDQKGLTLDKVGKALSMGASTLSAYERDTRSPPYNTLVQLADYYDVNLDYLLGRTRIRTSWRDLTASINLETNAIELIKAISKLPVKSQDRIIEYIRYEIGKAHLK